MVSLHILYSRVKGQNVRAVNAEDEHSRQSNHSKELVTILTHGHSYDCSSICRSDLS